MKRVNSLYVENMKDDPIYPEGYSADVEQHEYQRRLIQANKDSQEYVKKITGI